MGDQLYINSKRQYRTCPEQKNIVKTQTIVVLRSYSISPGRDRVGAKIRQTKRSRQPVLESRCIVAKSSRFRELLSATTPGFSTLCKEYHTANLTANTHNSCLKDLEIEVGKNPVEIEEAERKEQDARIRLVKREKWLDKGAGPPEIEGIESCGQPCCFFLLFFHQFFGRGQVKDIPLLL